MITNSVYTSDDFKSMDENCGIDPGILMENAAKAVFARIGELDLREPFAVCCGKGNNGGDGWALACIMQDRGIEVTVLEVREPESPLCVYWAEKYRSMGGRVTGELSALDSCATVIDCIFGFSFRGKLREDFVPVITKINFCGAKVLSVDVPSGADCDSPGDSTLFVWPDFTCTFTALKRVLAQDPYRQRCGRIFIEDIGTPEETILKYSPLEL